MANKIGRPRITARQRLEDAYSGAIPEALVNLVRKHVAAALRQHARTHRCKKIK